VLVLRRSRDRAPPIRVRSSTGEPRRSPAVRSIDVEERRARLAVRHRLAPWARPDDDISAIARSVTALHATDPLTVVLSALVRMRTPSLAPIERALYEDRTVVRMLAMRRTLWGVPVEDAPVVQAGASDAVAAVERKRLVGMLEDAGVTSDGAGWLRRRQRQALAAMDELGEATAAQLGAAVPALAGRMTLAGGKSYETTVSIASRLLVVLGAEGHVVRGRPGGAWTGSQHRWVPRDRWLPPAGTAPSAAEARAALARSWLERFGPGTVADLKWWTGWTLGATRTALAALDTTEVDLDGAPGMVLAGDEAPTEPPEPWVALLPALDPTVMGWQGRAWYGGDHLSAVFDRNGNAGPTVWADGRVVGAWGQGPDGEIRHRLLEDVGADHERLLDDEAARVHAALDGIVVKPRFTSALSKELCR
jgi:hypothetical protein